MTAQEFQVHFLRLIALTWTLPPMVGFTFLLYIEFFTFEQLFPMMSTPLMSIFVVGSLLFAIVYFYRYIRPLKLYLSASENHQELIVIRALRYFPLHYWMMFLVYILVAPAATILSLEMATDYIALPAVTASIFTLVFVSLMTPKPDDSEWQPFMGEATD